MIKSSDNGGLSVVLDVEVHKSNTIHQFSDDDTCAKLKGNPTNAFKRDLRLPVCRGVKGRIFTEEEGDIFITTPTTCSFYAGVPPSPKTYKGLDPLLGRPFAAGIASLKEQLCQCCCSSWLPVCLGI